MSIEQEVLSIAIGEIKGLIQPFREMLCAFTSFGQLRNGLLDGENRELLTSCDPETITSLVRRSMHRLGRLRAR